MPTLTEQLKRLLGQELVDHPSPHYAVGRAEVLMRFDNVNHVCKVGKPCVGEDGKIVCIPRKHKCNTGEPVVSGKDIKETLGTLALAGLAGVGVSAALQARNNRLQQAQENDMEERNRYSESAESILEKWKMPATLAGTAIAGGLFVATNPTATGLRDRIAQSFSNRSSTSSASSSLSQPTNPPQGDEPTTPSGGNPPTPPSGGNQPNRPSSGGNPPTPPSGGNQPNRPSSGGNPPTPASDKSTESSPPTVPPKPTNRPSSATSEKYPDVDTLLNQAQTNAQAVAEHKARKKQKSEQVDEIRRLEKEKMDLVSTFEQSEVEYEAIIQEYKQRIAELERGNELNQTIISKSNESIAELMRLREQVKDLQAAQEGLRSQKLELLVNDPNANAKQQYVGGTLFVERVPTESILADPKRFQYKQNAKSSSGATGSLADQTEYRELVAGALDVWRDPADGKTYVVNGHNRLELAKKTNTPEVAVNYLQVATEQEAKLLGAMLNIADERGTNKDAAILFRTIAQSENLSINKQYATTLMQSYTARNGIALSGLNDDTWNNYLDNKIPESVAIEIGKAANRGALTEDDQRFIAGIVMKSSSKHGAEDVEYLIDGIKTLKEMGKIEARAQQLGLFESGSGFSPEELEANARRLASINQELLTPLKDIKTLASAVKRTQSNQETFGGTLIESYARQISNMNLEEARLEAKKLQDFVKASLADPSSPLVQDVIIPLANEMRQVEESDVKKYLAQRNVFGMMVEKYQEALNPLAKQNVSTTTVQPRVVDPEPQQSTTRGSDATVRPPTTPQEPPKEIVAPEPQPAPQQQSVTSPKPKLKLKLSTTKTSTEANPSGSQETTPEPAPSPQQTGTNPPPTTTFTRPNEPVLRETAQTVQAKQPQRPSQTKPPVIPKVQDTEAIMALTREIRRNMQKKPSSVLSSSGDDVIEAKLQKNDTGWTVLAKSALDDDFKAIDTNLPTKQRALVKAEMWVLGEGLASIIEKRKAAQNKDEPKSDSWFPRHLRLDTEKSIYTKPKLREMIKQELMAGSKGGRAGQWSARKSQLLAQKYKAAGGGYTGKKTAKQKSLSRWTAQDWNYANPHRAKDKPRDQRGRYLPKAVWAQLSPQQKAATNRTKNAATRRGKQYAKWNNFIDIP